MRPFRLRRRALQTIRRTAARIVNVRGCVGPIGSQQSKESVRARLMIALTDLAGGAEPPGRVCVWAATGTGVGARGVTSGLYLPVMLGRGCVITRVRLRRG